MKKKMLLRPEKIEIDKIVIAEQKGNNSKIHYKDGDELVKFKIQTSKMRVPWSPKKRFNQNGKTISINVCASTYGILDDANKKRTENLKEKLQSIEKMIPNNESKTINSVIYGTNPEFSPVINLNVPYSDGNPDVVVFDNDKKVIPFESIDKGAICTFIVKVSHVWTTATKMGLQLVIEQIKVHKPSTANVMQIMDDDSDSD